MGKQFKVHSRHDTTVPVNAKTADGHAVEGSMPASIIELVPTGGGQTLTITEHTRTPEDANRIAGLFAVGATVEMGDFTAVKSA